jgi:hypothetical protein
MWSSVLIRWGFGIDGVVYSNTHSIPAGQHFGALGGRRLQHSEDASELRSVCMYCLQQHVLGWQHRLWVTCTTTGLWWMQAVSVVCCAVQEVPECVPTLLLEPSLAACAWWGVAGGFIACPVPCPVSPWECLLLEPMCPQLLNAVLTCQWPLCCGWNRRHCCITRPTSTPAEGRPEGGVTSGPVNAIAMHGHISSVPGHVCVQEKNSP